MSSETWPRRSRYAHWLALAGFAVVVFVTAAVGSLAASGAAGEYSALVRPSWSPPSWLFGPVWTVLYVMIAISGWLAWRKAGFHPALILYAAQLVLNAAWTPLFFGTGKLGLAFADILLLWVLIAALIVLFHRKSKPAAWLLVPYLGWVTFAAALNFSIWQLNS